MRVAALLLISTLAGVALADTLLRGESLPAPPTPSAPAAFQTNAGSAVNALAAHADGRIAAATRSELRVFDANGKLLTKQTLPSDGNAVSFGAAESIAVEMAQGSAIARSRGVFQRTWADIPAKAPTPIGLPSGGFAFARQRTVVLTDGEARELRVLQLPGEDVLLSLGLGRQGLLTLSARGGDVVLSALGFGERVHTRAIVRGTASAWRFEGERAELALTDGSLIELEDETPRRFEAGARDDGAVSERAPMHAVTPLAYGLAVVVHRGQLTLAARDGAHVALGASFGPPIVTTDAGMVLPTIRIERASATEPAWILTADGTLWRARDAQDVQRVSSGACDGKSAQLAVSPGRAVLACRDQLSAFMIE